ncbi:MAG: aspartate-semialdehyde dehydrogenase [Deltaproteobacteria bacterium]
MRKKRVAVVGATGIAGQQFVAALARHPWFTLTHLGASARSAGKTYGEALKDPGSGQLRWWADGEPPAKALGLKVEEGSKLSLDKVDLVFSAVEADVAAELEPQWGQTTPVVSTASTFRMRDEVPLLLPGVSFDHLGLIKRQRREYGWKGFVIPQPNCTVTGLAITLKPLARAFGLKRVTMVSMQGISGAGRSPGVTALDAIDNIIPFIPKEEEKVCEEACKLLGTLSDGRIVPARIKISATCTRAAVLEGHTEAVSVELGRNASPDDVAAVFKKAGRDLLRLGLPSMPERLIRVHDDPFRPQPRLDRDEGGGMTTSVGRIRRDSVFKNGIKYLLVSHNTKMGAARGAILVAEYLVKKGYA